MDNNNLEVLTKEEIEMFRSELQLVDKIDNFQMNPKGIQMEIEFESQIQFEAQFQFAHEEQQFQYDFNNTSSWS